MCHRRQQFRHHQRLWFDQLRDLPSLANVITASATGSGGTGTLGLNCTTGTNYTVALDNGLNASGSQRRMASSVPAYISYNLYQDSAHALPWNSTTGTLTGTGTGSAIPLIVYGPVPAAGTTPAAGVYSDTVTMTVTVSFIVNGAPSVRSVIH